MTKAEQREAAEVLKRVASGSIGARRKLQRGIGVGRGDAGAGERSHWSTCRATNIVIP
jgi:hypothetical protein